VALLLVGGSGLAAYWSMRPGPAGPRTVQATIVTTIALALLTALVLAFLANQVSPAWSVRYFAALVGPLLLLAGGVLSRAGNLGLVTVALLAGLWLHPPTGKINNKSDVHRVGVLLRGQVSPGDIVVSTHPEHVPVEAFYFPKGLRWASGMGWYPDTRIFDWRDALDRYRAARPRPTEDRFVRALRPGQQLILAQPILRTASWRAPWTKLVKRRAIAWERILEADPRLTRVAAIPHLRGHGPLPRGIRVVLYRREAPRPVREQRR
jgi:hypothetical protein